MSTETEAPNQTSQNHNPETNGNGQTDRPSPCPKYRRNGNVARLPKPVRDKINLMIQDGVPYGEIIARLGEDGEGLDISNLSRWKDGGYQDWLVEQAFIERTRARQETPGELVRDFDATEVNHAALQLATLHIFETLRDLTPGSLHSRGQNDDSSPGSSGPPLPSDGRGIKGEGSSDPGGNGAAVSAPLDTQHSSPAASAPNHTRTHRHRTVLDQKLGGDSAAFVRLINALARASRETMLLQKYRNACAQARAALSELKDPKRKLTESERRAIVLQVDDILGLGSPEDEEPEPGGHLPESQVDPSPGPISSSSSSSSSIGPAPTEPPRFATTA